MPLAAATVVHSHRPPKGNAHVGGSKASRPPFRNTGPQPVRFHGPAQVGVLDLTNAAAGHVNATLGAVDKIGQKAHLLGVHVLLSFTAEVEKGADGIFPNVPLPKSIQEVVEGGVKHRAIIAALKGVRYTTRLKVVENRQRKGQMELRAYNEHGNSIDLEALLGPWIGHAVATRLLEEFTHDAGGHGIPKKNARKVFGRDQQRQDWLKYRDQAKARQV